jgi:hypothetical protein
MSLTPPKRLFHVPSMSTVFYKDVADDVKEKGYVAVSHVWGKQKLYEPEKLGILGGINWRIPLSNLRKMGRLRGGMEFFRKEYCWWDILCMPQDKQEEIIEEIPLMGDYYSGARMTFVLSDEEYENCDNLNKWLFIMRNVAKEKRPLTLEEHRWMEGLEKDLFDISKDQWFNRVWTLQEASLSVDLILMSANNIYITLSDIIVPISRAMDTGDTRISNPFHNMHKLMVMGFNCSQNVRYLGSVMQAVLSRDCYKPQDRFYGVLGILGYKDFPVSYDISMEDLNKKIIQYACSKGDMSWLTVTGCGIDSFIPLLHLNFTYASSTWVENSPDKCNASFKDDAFYINAADCGKIVDCKYFFAPQSGELQSIQDGILVLKDWGLTTIDILFLMVEFKEIPDDILDMTRTCIMTIFLGYKCETAFQYLASSYGYDIAKHIGHIQQHMKGLVAVNSTIAKVSNGKHDLLLFIQGHPDIGDRILLTNIHNLINRGLGIVVDDHGRRKGVYRTRKLKVRDELYIQHKFLL